MNEVVRFQTRARTVDHLGREQIADCPTAISELWKNSYDAYARSSSLHIFNGAIPTAAILDDGHGMSRDEFINKWLVLGTDSKLGSKLTPLLDRGGLPYRKRQGKKGIGRLSVAFLAKLLLVVTKRQNSDFVACLIDWRIFENPFLMLDDIELPISTFKHKEDLFGLLPSLFETLMGNVWGSPLAPARQSRIEEAWESFDTLEHERAIDSAQEITTTRESLERSILEMPFEQRQIEQWPLWQDDADSGTALIMSGIVSDLEAQLVENPKFAHESTAKETFRSTLWSFSDPFGPIVEVNPNTGISDFETSVIGWIDERRLSILERFGGFPAELVSRFEHIVDGQIDEKGTFEGRIKAFGKWLPDRVVIHAIDIQPNRSDTRVGSFSIFIGTMEIEPKNTTLTPEEHNLLISLLESYSGLMVFRDGFRVMPYGRSDSDFFDVETRRSKNAGREFWNHRRMLGRVAISDFENPNLKDKAGREGIIDNRASKAFRQNTINVLQVCARRFFGSRSEERKKILPELQSAYQERRANEDREKLATKDRRDFRRNLEAKGPDVDQLLSDLHVIQHQTNHSNKSAEDLTKGLELVREAKNRRSELVLGRPPASLAPKVTNLHLSYKEKCKNIDTLISSLQEMLLAQLDEFAPAAPKDVVNAYLEKQSSYLKRRNSKWLRQITDSLDGERKRVEDYVKLRSKLLTERVGFVAEDVGNKISDISSAIRMIETETTNIDEENQNTLTPIVSVLNTLSESINLELLATTSNDEILSLRSDLERLNGLAQLGITVEIISHELESYDSTIEYGLSHLPEETKQTSAYRQIKDGHHGLASRLRFLSPLKLSGEPERRSISGLEIQQFIESFFGNDLESGLFKLEVTADFKEFAIFEQPARIFPVFLNLVNNARYWIMQDSASAHLIKLDLIDGRIIIADDGPGIPDEDLKELFSLFFTRRRGGRGVGLYLCRANLAAGGHQISYIKNKDERILRGANFSVKFRNV